MKHRHLAAALAMVAACGDAPPDVATAPAAQTTSAGGKADVYGDDSRRELFDAAVPADVRDAAASTAILVGPGGFYDIGATTMVLAARTLGQKIAASEGGAACDSEPFIDQPAPGFCSGFLIAPDLVATAGHCVNINTPFHAASYVFGFAYESASDTDVRSVPTSDVYRVSAVVGHVYNRGEPTTLADLAGRELWEDWAVVQLERPVTGREPLTLREAPLEAGDAVTAVGHPMGIPSKVAAGEVYDASKRHYVNTDLDIFQGNSGSVVLDDAARAAGIVIRGSGGDSYVQTSAGCYASRECADVDTTSGSQCTGNHVMRIDALRDFVDPAVDTVVSNQVVGDATIPDGDPAGVVVSQQIDAPGDVAWVTVNANMFHARPADLEIILERDGRAVSVARGPKVWTGGEVRFSRTTREFTGESAAGTWTLRVIDRTAGGGSYQTLGWWQLAIGVRP